MNKKETMEKAKGLYFRDMLSNREFSPERPIKKDIMASKNFNIVVVCLEEGQEIKPHPEPYAVFFLVLEGNGIFTNSKGSFELCKNSCIHILANEARGIRCLEKMVVLGVQDGHETSKRKRGGVK